MTEADRAELILDSQIKLRDRFCFEAMLELQDRYPGRPLCNLKWFNTYIRLWSEYARTN
ncbi:hypothetical protein ABFB50_00925 [Dehalococcoides sp. THU3]|uniref:hypothetical protein n=1 Tax=Dehalococcoides TaxID=61434 RepID=UPI0032183127